MGNAAQQAKKLGSDFMQEGLFSSAADGSQLRGADSVKKPALITQSRMHESIGGNSVHLAASPFGALERRSAQLAASSASVRSTPCFRRAALSSSDAAEACCGSSAPAPCSSCLHLHMRAEAPPSFCKPSTKGQKFLSEVAGTMHITSCPA